MGAELIQVWGNGRWGLRTRRRIYLYQLSDDTFRVDASQGGEYGWTRAWRVSPLAAVDVLVEFLQEPDGDDRNDGWRDMTRAYPDAARRLAERFPARAPVGVRGVDQSAGVIV